ncbi:hypothetical protein B0H14DRAFT_3665075 [Mycena olivaceomarginata]|nr:hypothetical protein B0H14DRAFT_3665075 [Mycena olivaceomarginata]
MILATSVLSLPKISRFPSVSPSLLSFEAREYSPLHPHLLGSQNMLPSTSNNPKWYFLSRAVDLLSCPTPKFFWIVQDGSESHGRNHYFTVGGSLDQQVFRHILDEDQRKHGKNNTVFDETAVDEFQQGVDDLVDIGVINMAMSVPADDA